MRGILLDPITGLPDGDAQVPESDEIRDWKRKLAERDVYKQLEMSKRHPGLQGTTTTNRYLSYPAAAAGISKASSGSTAWSFSTYIEIVPVNTITATYYIAGFTWMWHTPTQAADITHEVLFELATGAGGSEVLIIQIPSSARCDTAVGNVPSNFVMLPEPKQIAANTRISMRVAQSLATTVHTYTGVKIWYQIA